MESSMLNMKVLNRSGLLYPLLVIAAVAVIVFSAFGVAAITGMLPRAESMESEHALNATGANAPPVFGTARSSGPACAECGVVESITPVAVKGSASGLGIVAGGVTGALFGNQIGRGNGNALATIAGAAGGAYAGNEIEKNMHDTVRYEIRVRMRDGSHRMFYQPAAPSFAVGNKVRVVDGRVVAVA